MTYYIPKSGRIGTIKTAGSITEARRMAVSCIDRSKGQDAVIVYGPRMKSIGEVWSPNGVDILWSPTGTDDYFPMRRDGTIKGRS